MANDANFGNEQDEGRILTIAERIQIGRDSSYPPNEAIVEFPDTFGGEMIHMHFPAGYERNFIARALTNGYKETIYLYRSAEGRVIHAIVRLDHPTEPKIIRPLRFYGRPSVGGNGYLMEAIDGMRPLYGLDQLASRPDAPVLVVEGEKTADAAAKLFPDFVTITWSGGANGVRQAEMVALSERDVILWPDNDEAGRKAMRTFAAFAYNAGAASVSLVDIPEELGKKWDLADEYPAEIGAKIPMKGLVGAAKIVTQEEVGHLANDAARLAEPSRLLGHKPGYSRVPIEMTETALMVLDPAMYRSMWVRVARAIFYAYGGDGAELFDRWSQGSPEKYRAGEPSELWAKFDNELHFRADSLFWLFERASGVILARNESAEPNSKSNVALDIDAIWLASIEELNESHAFVTRGGKTAVLWEHYDPRFGRFAQTYLQKNDFLNHHVQKIVVPREEGDDSKREKRSSRGTAWFNSVRRRKYDDVVFAPGQHLGPTFLNLWQGFAVEPADNPEGWSRLKQHLFDNVAHGDEASYQYLLNWMASAVQRIDRPIGTALVLVGKKGVGKSIITDFFGQLFGQHAFVTPRMDDVLGRFNHLLETTLLLGLEEAVAPGNRAADGVLKDLLTRKTLRLEEKFYGVWTAPNYLRVIITSNNEHVVRADGSERRYAVFEVTNPHQSDPNARKKYFAQMDEQMGNGGLEAMLGELKNRDISQWNQEAIPETEALRRQKQYSMSHNPVESYLSDRLMDGIRITGEEGSYVPIYEWSQTDIVMVPARVLAADFLAYCDKNGLKATSRQLYVNLPRYMPEGFRAKTLRGERGEPADRQFKAYPFPPIEEARLLFENVTGIASPREPPE